MAIYQAKIDQDFSRRGESEFEHRRKLQDRHQQSMLRNQWSVETATNGPVPV